jgi:hypothetical protein
MIKSTFQRTLDLTDMLDAGIRIEMKVAKAMIKASEIVISVAVLLLALSPLLSIRTSMADLSRTLY